MYVSKFVSFYAVKRICIQIDTVTSSTNMDIAKSRIYSEVLWIEFQARLLTNSNKLKDYYDGYSEPNLRLLEMKNNEIYTFTANCKIIVKLSNTN